jgi:phosphatidylserine/phosphatidylglycerophosphate/cardiolipin synthase-like enzyme
MKSGAILLTLILLLPAAPSQAREPTIWDNVQQAVRAHTDKAPAAGQIETGFSPDGGGERLVLKAVNASTSRLCMAAYSLTSPSIVQALIAAKRRGVDVRIVADDSNARSKSGAAALNLLVGAQIKTRLNSRYAIHHDKFIIVDDRHVQTGSFNYSQAAAKSNSENVLVVWHNEEVAASYLRHWTVRFEEGKDYRRPY